MGHDAQQRMLADWRYPRRPRRAVCPPIVLSVKSYRRTDISELINVDFKLENS